MGVIAVLEIDGRPVRLTDPADGTLTARPAVGWGTHHRTRALPPPRHQPARRASRTVRRSSQPMPALTERPGAEQPKHIAALLTLRMADRAHADG